MTKLEAAIWATAMAMYPSHPKATLRCVLDMPKSAVGREFFARVRAFKS